MLFYPYREGSLRYTYNLYRLLCLNLIELCYWLTCCVCVIGWPIADTCFCLVEYLHVVGWSNADLWLVGWMLTCNLVTWSNPDMWLVTGSNPDLWLVGWMLTCDLVGRFHADLWLVGWMLTCDSFFDLMRTCDWLLCFSDWQGWRTDSHHTIRVRL